MSGSGGSVWVVPCFISVFIIPSGWASARRHRVIRSNSINEKRFPAVLKRIVITPFHPFFSVAKPRSETRISIIYFGIFSVYPEHGKVRNCRASPTRNSRLKVKWGGFQDLVFSKTGFFWHFSSFKKWWNRPLFVFNFEVFSWFIHFLRRRRFFHINLAAFSLTRRSEASQIPGFL